MILDVAAADLEAAETRLGPFHPIAWHFRQALADAKRAWERLRAELGGATLRAALDEPPLAYLTLNPAHPGGPKAILIPIGGRTYRVEKVEATPAAPSIYRLTRLAPPLENGPYYPCRLEDGSTQCDCAEWTFHADDADPPGSCKHLAALAALGWI